MRMAVAPTTNVCRGLVVGIIALAACTDAVTSPTASNARLATVNANAAVAELRAAAQGRSLRGPEDDVLRIENALPGFGGMFQDSAGNLTLYTPRGVAPGVIKAALAQVAPTLHLGASVRAHLAGAQGLRFIDADYPFSQIVAWQSAFASRVTPRTGILGLDADEGKDRLRVLIVSDTAAGTAERITADAGIPAGAVVLEVSGRFAPTSSVRGTWRPAGGGIQISDNVSGEVPCNIGFNVTAGDQTKGFITAAHCDHYEYGVTGDVIHQPTVNNPVGFVRLNPPWNSTDALCMGASVCSDADVMYVQYNDPSLAVKRVAYTDFAGTNNAGGSITVTGWWNNITWPATPLVGTLVDKIGRESGWTRGTLTATCVAMDVGYGTITCLNVVADSRVGEGDSGAPVFMPPPPGQVTQPLQPVGILVGGNVNQLTHYDAGTGVNYCDGSNGTCISYYSPWAQIQNHLQSPLDPVDP